MEPIQSNGWVVIIIVITKIIIFRSKGVNFFLSLYKWWNNNNTRAFTTLILWGHSWIYLTEFMLWKENIYSWFNQIYCSSEELGARIPKAFVPLQKSEGFLVFILLFFYEAQLNSLQTSYQEETSLIGTGNQKCKRRQSTRKRQWASSEC